MTHFNQIEYDKEKKTLDVGAGVIWKDVYNYLEPFASDHAPGVVGGDPLVGVSGWLLGGGYSIQTNSFGLGIDNIVGFRVLLPDKAVCNVSREENPEIFKALKVRSLYHNNNIIAAHSFDWEGRRA
jgi:FAD/FMN-containing dehydrogenase